jgi:hypothetical protein
MEINMSFAANANAKTMEAIEQSHSNEECIKFKKKLKK